MTGREDTIAGADTVLICASRAEWVPALAGAVAAAGLQASEARVGWIAGDAPVPVERVVLALDVDVPRSWSSGDRVIVRISTEEPEESQGPGGNEQTEGWLFLGASPEPELLSAVLRLASRGFAVQGPGSGAAPPGAGGPDHEPPGDQAEFAGPPLTPRQIAVLGLVAEGLANKEIAFELDLSVQTVKHHLSAIFSRLGVQSRTEAVTAAARIGLLAL